METKSIYQKLLACQKEFGAIEKTKENPYYRSHYADINDYLGAIKPILTKHGLVLLQPIDETNLKTILVDAETGEKIESLAVMPVNTDPQKQGMIITYFRRYAIQSLLSLQAEDNDANDTEKSEYPPSTKQLTYLKTLLTKAGFKDDQAKFRYLTDNLNTLIVSWEDLTRDQASKAIDGLVKPELEKAEATDSAADAGYQEKIINE